MVAALGVKEDDAEQGVLDLFRDVLGYEVEHGRAFAPDEPGSERDTYNDVVLTTRLDEAIRRHPANAGLGNAEIGEAIRVVETFQTGNLLADNMRFHELLIEGVPVEVSFEGGTQTRKVQLVDWDNAAANDFLAVNQFMVVERDKRRPDVLVFVNGLPLGVIELKSPTDDDATVLGAWSQLQTYKQKIPTLLSYNGVLVASDQWEARAGSLSANFDRFAPWRSIAGTDYAPPSRTTIELPIALQGIFEKSRLLDLVRHYTVFHQDGAEIHKIVAQYHQFYGMNAAVEQTVAKASGSGDGRIGVVWHTQGSGKSLSMVFYAGKVMQSPAMENPTLVVLTDRNDLDDQLFGTFAASAQVLREAPVQAESVGHLKELLAQRQSGGIIFTTIQKFRPETGEQFPVLSERSNIVFMADEAHRSHTDLLDGFARHVRDALPNAAFIGFTGTPIESGDAYTAAVFGSYIDIYDIHRAVEDGATVKIFYEARLAQLVLDEGEKPTLDDEFEELTEAEEASGREKLKSRWARLEALVGSEKRLEQVAADIVKHWEQREQALAGKGMIVTMSRAICVRLYDEIVKLRPDWHADDDEQGAIKVVMSGAASDQQEWQPHIRNKQANRRLAKRMRDPNDPLKLVIVRDMWLTGFDAPSMHTMYVDKPMRGHNLMQAIARVNRVFKDKPAGLIVDYLGIADQMKRALSDYTRAGKPADDDVDNLIEQAVHALQEKHRVIVDSLHGVKWQQVRELPKGQWAQTAAVVMDHVLGTESGEQEFIKHTNDLLKAFAIAATHEAAIAIKTDVEFFHLVKTGFVRITVEGAKHRNDLESAIQQLMSRAVVSEGVIDIFDAAGMAKPDVSILSDEFLDDIKNLPHKNLALEALRKMLTDEVKRRGKTNVVEAKSFTELLEKAISRYHSHAITMAELLDEMIELAKDLRERGQRGEKLGLSEAELAFFDAVADNDKAREVMADDVLAQLAREITATVKHSATVDWTQKESIKAGLRRAIKRILRNAGYPPDPDDYVTAVGTVLAQAEQVAGEWTE